MIIDFKEYKEIQEQKKAIIWDFIFNFFEGDYVKSAIAYKEITETVKSVNSHYEMILRKLNNGNK